MIELADGRTVFAKCGREEVVAEFIRDEHRLFSVLQADFMPRLIAFLDEPQPVLVLEDLSEWHWPPPWPEGGIEAVLATLRRVHATPAPPGVPSIEIHRERLVTGWEEIGENRDAFIALGVCSAAWLDEALPRLREASAAAPIGGEALLHLDVRSDNLCLLDGGAVLVDWNHACTGNGELDVVAWLPSLHLEGGPRPDEVLPRCAPELPAVLAGFFGSRAYLPPPPTAPHVRTFQLAQLRVVLPWAARALGLPEPR